jgi:hypothetical protein
MIPWPGQSSKSCPLTAFSTPAPWLKYAWRCGMEKGGDGRPAGLKKWTHKTKEIRLHPTGGHAMCGYAACPYSR